MNSRFFKRVFFGLVSGILALGLFFPLCGHAARIKDLAAIKGIRSNQLMGYGLVIGLQGTGDNSSVSFTEQSLINMMEKMNIYDNGDSLSVSNVASVMVTAQIPPFARIGDRLDITVSSLGDADSLEGGTLLLTQLKGVDAKVYALAQGAISLALPADAKSSDSHLVVARMVNGATVEREIPFQLNGKEHLTLSLLRPDFTTARRMADTINIAVGQGSAVMIDSSALKLTVPENMRKAQVAQFIADIETLSVIPDSLAKVVINERTGTVVIGRDVTISSVAVAHGDLSVTIDQADQENAEPVEGRVMMLEGTSTIGELVRGLNSLGVKPRDLISILEGIKAAGALQAELEILSGVIMIQNIDTIQSQMLAGKLTEAQKTNTESDEALMEACEGFEAIITKTMLDSMRATLPGNALFPKSNAQDILESMRDQQLAEDLSKTPNGLGLKEFLYNQLNSSS